MKKLFLLSLCAAGAAHAESNELFVDGFDPLGSCPSGRVESTTMSWRYDGVGRRSIDVTQAENIWGRGNAGAPTVPFPWMNVFSIFWTFPRHGYVAARFQVPMDVPSWSFGMFTRGETLPGPEADMAISTRCGDFNPAQEYCVTRATRVGQRMGTWGLPAFPGAACELQPGQTYYLNIRLTDPAVEDYFCNTGTCRMTVQHNHSP